MTLTLEGGLLTTVRGSHGGRQEAGETCAAC